jgi:hypothetical protein
MLSVKDENGNIIFNEKLVKAVNGKRAELKKLRTEMFILNSYSDL